MAKMSKEELLKAIFEEKQDIMDDEELLDMLIHEKVSQDIEELHNGEEHYGAKMSDALAQFVGSWKFIIGFIIILMVWITMNVLLLTRAFDPFPFILLNLVLSCIAAIQAPIIMMSQNRQEQKDRTRAKNDYRVNLKSEVIVEDLHEKLEQLFANQMELLNKIKELDSKVENNNK